MSRGTASSRWRWIRPAVLVPLVIVVFVGAAAALAAVDGLAVRSSLQAAQTEVREARSLLAQGEVKQARQRLQAAQGRIRQAAGRTDRMLWSAVEVLPVLGRSVATVRGVVEVAESAVTLGLQATEEAGGLLGGDGQASIRTKGGSLDLSQLQAAGEVLAGLPVRQLDRARDQLAAAPASWVPAPLARARADTLELAGQAVGVADDARRLLEVLGPFLGGQEPRRYLVVMQNPAELRGTGGLPGFVSVLRADQGDLALTRPQQHAGLNRDPTKEVSTPVEVPAVFLDRYGPAGANSLFANVNLDPDLPTTASVMLDLYQQRADGRLDGVVAVDPVALESLFQLVGPLDVPGAVSHPELPDPIPAGQIAETTMIRAYEAFGGRNPRRDLYLEETALAAFRQLLSSDWDAAAMGQRMARLTRSRNLQLYSTRPAEQEVFRQLRVAGRLAPGRGASDLLAVTANNAAGNKADVHVGHRLSADIELQLPGQDADLSGIEEVGRRATVRTTVRNPLPGSGMPDYIIGSYDRPHQEGGTRTINGLVRTWLSLWAPERTGLTAARAGGEPAQVAGGRIHGHQVFDYFLETPSESTTWWEADLRGPAPVTVEDGRLVYRLTWWRQAKAIPDRLELTVGVPDGWKVADAAISGGGPPSGMGVWGDGQEVQLASDPGRVTVEGSAIADVQLEVAVVPNEGFLERVLEGATAWAR